MASTRTVTNTCLYSLSCAAFSSLVSRASRCLPTDGVSMAAGAGSVSRSLSLSALRSTPRSPKLANHRPNTACETMHCSYHGSQQPHCMHTLLEDGLLLLIHLAVHFFGLLVEVVNEREALVNERVHRRTLEHLRPDRGP